LSQIANHGLPKADPSFALFYEVVLREVIDQQLLQVKIVCVRVGGSPNITRAKVLKVLV
jgi:hypothetical protein